MMTETNSQNGSGLGAIVDNVLPEGSIQKIREQLSELDTRAREIVQERPLLAVGVAVAFGFAAARFMRRMGDRRSMAAKPYLMAAAGLAGRLALQQFADKAVRRLAQDGRSPIGR